MPDVRQAALDCERFGAEGITVHPRPDERHIRYSDVREIRPLITTEFNIEGNPIDSFTDLVLEVLPDQVTLVPDAADAIGRQHPLSRICTGDMAPRKLLRILPESGVDIGTCPNRKDHKGQHQDQIGHIKSIIIKIGHRFLQNF